MTDTESIVAGLLNPSGSIQDAVLDAYPYGVLVINEQGTVIYHNRKMQSIFRSEWKFVGRSLSEFVREDRHVDLMREYFRSPSSATRAMAGGRVVSATAADGEDVRCKVLLGHGHWGNQKIACAAVVPVDDEPIQKVAE